MKFPVSIYIHWPYCLKKCGFCAFNKYPLHSAIDYSKLKSAYLAEISHMLRISMARDSHGNERVVQSIYFGGGTPSLAPPDLIGSLIQHIRDNFPTTDNLEITMEANPTRLEREKMADFRSVGVNRVSLGLQAFNDRDLTLLGREHTLSDNLHALDIAKGLFGGRVSIDLIYGRPMQQVAEWQRELESVVVPLLDTHVSIYQLSIEQGTPFHHKYHTDTIWKSELPSETELAEMYTVANEIMKEKAGFERYEVSSYAKTNSHRCIHNMAYWTPTDYYGVGPGAHGRFRVTGGHVVRTIQEPVPEKWADSWLSKDPPNSNETLAIPGSRLVKQLSADEVLKELLFMGLRTRDGVSQDEMIKYAGELTVKTWNDVGIDMQSVNELVEMRLIEMSNDWKAIKCTENGLDLLDSILPKLFSNHTI